MATPAYRPLCFLFFTSLVSLCAAAHEFWIEPVRFRVPSDGHITANLKVGQFFKGNVQPFIPQRFVEFSVTDSSGKRSVSGRLGDVPALDQPALRPGLHILAYQSRPQSAVYEEFAKFERFARREGNPWILDEHKRRGLPRRNVTEAYTRFAKALVQVGDEPGQDSVVGLPLELVLETNPYANISGNDLVVRLIWRGQGLASARISVFRKRGSCDATRTTLVTDESGRAVMPRGGGRFMANAVHVIEPTESTLDDINAVWESLWASTTFELAETSNPGDPPEECPPAQDSEDK